MVYVMKNGNNLQQNLSSSSESSPESSPWQSGPVSAPVSVVVSEAPEVSKSEIESDTQPMPPNSEDEPAARVCASHPAPRPYQGAKPEWWTPAWEHLNGHIIPQGNPLIPVCPKEFK
jgi:hypothetical protein